MIVLSNTEEITLQPNQALIFDEEVFRCGTNECRRKNRAAINVRNQGVYEVSFSGNIGGETAATAVQLAIAFGGADGVLAETTMISVPAAVADRNNVSTETRVRHCCCAQNGFSVMNTGTAPVVIAPNSSFVIERVS